MAPTKHRTHKTLKTVDAVTKDWIRNRNDELAALNGCVFDGERGEYVIDWMFDYLRLYEGEYAGQPFNCRHDWQREFHMQFYSWIRFDQEWTDIKNNGSDIWIRRFRQGSIWISKKQGKSPTLAANGLYLTCGDGEQGGKSYFFAKDGEQARAIAGTHAWKMLASSDALMSECSYHKNTMLITHEPSNSICQPQSSGDVRTQKSKEGINGNILIDETHVVDRELLDIVSRAHISRMEPAHLEFSTAGDNCDGYGYERHMYAKAVVRGDIVDQKMLVLDYSAPQETTDEQIHADPLKFGRMANPAMGRITRESEFMEDYQESRQKGLIEFGRFKMYRLNIWLYALETMIDGDRWSKSAAEYGIDRLAGRGGGLGLDFAKSNDMASAVFVSPLDKVEQTTLDEDGNEIQAMVDRCQIWPMFWMAENYARENSGKVKGFIEWAGSSLTLCPGSKISDATILESLMPAVKRIRPTMVVYDETFANDIALKIQEEMGEKQMEIDARSQGFPAYTEPTTEFLQDLQQGLVVHPNNACLNWQTRHTMLGRRDKLVKPMRPSNEPKDSYKKIDGVQAMVMGHLAYRRRPEPFESVYTRRGIISI